MSDRGTQPDQNLVEMGNELSRNAKGKTSNYDSSDADSDSPERYSADLADATTAADPPLARLLAAWQRLSYLARERLADQAEAAEHAEAMETVWTGAEA
jgi:hypothetical protein